MGHTYSGTCTHLVIFCVSGECECQFVRLRKEGKKVGGFKKSSVVVGIITSQL